MLVIPITLVVYNTLRRWQEHHVLQSHHVDLPADRRGFWSYGRPPLEMKARRAVIWPALGTSADSRRSFRFALLLCQERVTDIDAEGRATIAVGTHGGALPR